MDATFRISPRTKNLKNIKNIKNWSTSLLALHCSKPSHTESQETRILGGYYEILGKKLKIKGGGHLADACHEQASQIIIKT